MLRFCIFWSTNWSFLFCLTAIFTAVPRPLAHAEHDCLCLSTIDHTGLVGLLEDKIQTYKRFKRTLIYGPFCCCCCLFCFCCCFWSFLYSASPLRSRVDSPRSSVNTRVNNFSQRFVFVFVNIHRSGVLTALAWLVAQGTRSCRLGAFCVHHATMHHVTSCKATYVRCMRV